MENTATAQKELTITRVINAPRTLVFKAWTEKSQLVKWWGPNGFTNPVCEVDVRPGGSIYMVMRAPDGNDFPMGGKFIEITEPSKLVFTSTALQGKEGNTILENLNTVTFEEIDGKTKLTLHVEVKKATPEAKQALEGMEAGWTQSIVKLSELF